MMEVLRAEMNINPSMKSRKTETIGENERKPGAGRQLKEMSRTVQDPKMEIKSNKEKVNRGNSGRRKHRNVKRNKTGKTDKEDT